LLLFAGIMVWRQSLTLAIVLISCVVVFFVVFQLPFENVERVARAPRRRGECIGCGTKLTDGAERLCAKCDA